MCDDDIDCEVEFLHTVDYLGNNQYDIFQCVNCGTYYFGVRNEDDDDFFVDGFRVE